MAKIAFGIGSSHGPMLSTPPDMWHLRAGADRNSSRHFFRGKVYDFAGLVADRQPGFAEQITLAERQKRYDACQRSLDALAAKFREMRPDAVVIVGNDQRELYRDDNTPALLVYTGSKIENIPPSEEEKASYPPGIAVAAEGNCPPGGAVYAGGAGLAVHLVQSLIDQDFDVSEASQLPKPDGQVHGIPHAFGFLYRRIMEDNPPPSVPVFINAGVPNNRPRVRRCLRFGRALAKAIQDWNEDARVAVFASGGLTHFVIDEEFDQRVLKAMRERDEAALEAIPEDYLLGNTCEMRNWLAVSAAMNAAGKKITMADYVACYRTEAGTGNAMGFVCWQ